MYVTLRRPNYCIDWDEVRRAITPRTRVILVNTPHNPTGMVLDQDDIRELERVLEHTDSFVVSDGVYEHIVFDAGRHESMARHPAIAERAVVISSFGKTYHTTGWKIGYCVAPRPLAAEVARVHQWVTYAVNTPIQRAYAEMVTRDPMCMEVTSFYQAKRDLFLQLLQGSRFRPIACRGTFFQVVDYSEITDEHDAEFAIRLTSMAWLQFRSRRFCRASNLVRFCGSALRNGTRRWNARRRDSGRSSRRAGRAGKD